MPALMVMLWLLATLPQALAWASDKAADSASPTAAIVESLHILPELSGRMDLAQAQQAYEEGRFLENTRPAGNYGFVDGGMWFHLQLRNPGVTESDWLLVVEYPLIDHLSLFTIDDDGLVNEQVGGDREPFASRAVPMREPNFRLQLPPGKTVSVFLRAESESSMQVPIVVEPTSSYLANRIPGNQALGVYYGVLLALGLYNLILFSSVRDRIFLWYVAYIISFGVLVAVLNGLTFQYLWPQHPDFGNRFLIVGIPVALIAMLQFSRRFLETQRHAPLLHRAINWMMVILLLESITALFLSYRTVVRIETLSVFIVTPLVLVTAIRVLPRFRPARYFLLAWSTLLISIAVYSAVSLGLLPKHPLTEYSVQMGSALEMILLSFALAYRFNLLKAENERIQSSAREQLESHVRARTHELNATLKRLEDANHRLEAFSRRDGLTNVYNRRHLDSLMQQALKDAEDRQHPLALLMLDVDHFKRINDQYGHLAGDDCLRSVARVCRELCSGQDSAVARYGGEEFVILLPTADRDAALKLAEDLRYRVEHLPVLFDGQSIPLTVSIGVHVANHELLPDHAEQLLAAADAALYLAKQNGRNQVQLDAASRRTDTLDS